MVDDIAPPKKKKVGRKRTTTVSAKTQTLKEKFVKAKKSATRTLNAEKKKVGKDKAYAFAWAQHNKKKGKK